MTVTVHRDVSEILADLGDFKIANTGAKALALYHELEDALRVHVVPLPESEAERLAEQAEAEARTIAPPTPGVTRNSGYTVQAVMPGAPAEPGSLAYWWVACEDAGRGAWVTWMACEMDGERAGFLAYDGGHYCTGPDPAVNKREALADLAIRAGTMTEVGLRIAGEVENWTRRNDLYPESNAEDKRMARRLRKWLGR